MWKRWKIAFCAFYEGQNVNDSGERTLFALLGKLEQVKQAIATGREDSCFRLVAPHDADPSPTLLASERKLGKKEAQDHPLSGRMRLPRLCSDTSATDRQRELLLERGQEPVTDRRFVLQRRKAGTKEEWDFRVESELADEEALGVLRAFFQEARDLPAQGAFLFPPALDVDFEIVTQELIDSVKACLEFPWGAVATQEAQKAFLSKWQPCTKRKKGGESVAARRRGSGAYSSA